MAVIISINTFPNRDDFALKTNSFYKSRVIFRGFS
jgi:hypothetical protein